MNNTENKDINKLQWKDSGMKNSNVNILWTGGFDSSFRMIQLSVFPITIQPFYLCDNRLSEQLELNAISAITTDIENHPDTKCKILPLLKFKVSDIQPDWEITEAYKRINKLTNAGSQYDFLARFAKSYEGLELSFEKGETANGIYMHIKEKGHLITITNQHISYAILDKEKSDPDLFRIFGAFHFPLPLLNLTKLEELEEYKKMGFEASMHKTWFCHKPIKNSPCGICNPCKAVVEKGLAFRLTPAGLARYETEMKYGKFKWFILLKKIRNKIAGY